MTRHQSDEFFVAFLSALLVCTWILFPGPSVGILLFWKSRELRKTVCNHALKSLLISLMFILGPLLFLKIGPEISSLATWYTLQSSGLGIVVVTYLPFSRFVPSTSGIERFL